MARKVIVRLVDDLDGSDIPEGAGETVRFSFEGTEYEIDLVRHNADAFRSALAPFVQSARKVAPSRKRRSTTAIAAADGPPASQIRAWARENDFDVPDRGRIPPTIRDAYAAAHSEQ